MEIFYLAEICKLDTPHFRTELGPTLDRELVLSCLVWLRLNTPGGVKREGFVCAHEILIYSKCSFSCALNSLGSSMLTIDDGRAFQSVTVLGRKEYL